MGCDLIRRNKISTSLQLRPMPPTLRGNRRSPPTADAMCSRPATRLIAQNRKLMIYVIHVSDPSLDFDNQKFQSAARGTAKTTRSTQTFALNQAEEAVAGLEAKARSLAKRSRIKASY